MDGYRSFKDLAAGEVLGRDYRIRVLDRGAAVTIAAPHGGRIEPGTSRTAALIAGERFNCYYFEGIKPAGNGILHIPSHRFDEPRALALLAASRVVVTVHACREREPVLYLGGRDSRLAEKIRTELSGAGIPVSAHDTFRGLHPRNICNLGNSGKGIQLELSRGLRDDPARLAAAAGAVGKVLRHHDLHP